MVEAAEEGADCAQPLPAPGGGGGGSSEAMRAAVSALGTSLTEPLPPPLPPPPLPPPPPPLPLLIAVGAARRRLRCAAALGAFFGAALVTGAAAAAASAAPGSTPTKAASEFAATAAAAATAAPAAPTAAAALFTRVREGALRLAVPAVSAVLAFLVSAATTATVMGVVGAAAGASAPLSARLRLAARASRDTAGTALEGDAIGAAPLSPPSAFFFLPILLFVLVQFWAGPSRMNRLILKNTSTGPHPMASQTENDRKYDRQLRLWGSHGQKALMESHILLIGAGPTGTETLKNLVLPGVGRFTVLDGATIGASDRANNFFIDPDTPDGRPRAEVTARLLGEMNADVVGAFRVADGAALLDTEPEYFTTSGFTLVVATQLTTPTLRRLARVLAGASPPLPLLAVRSSGLAGYCRLAVPEHTVIESKPDGLHHDLRLSAPFPELAAHAAAVDLSAMTHVADAKQRGRAHSHVPWAVVLATLLPKHVAAAGPISACPSAFSKEAREWKAAFCELLKAESVGFMRRAAAAKAAAAAEEEEEGEESIAVTEGAWGDEQNFVEAVANAHLCYSDSAALPPDVRALLGDGAAAEDAIKARAEALRAAAAPGAAAAANAAAAKAAAAVATGAAAAANAANAANTANAANAAPTRDSHQFWLLVAALGRFVAAEGGGRCVPLAGSLPDMTATTEAYVALQNVYVAKARADEAAFAAHVAALHALLVARAGDGDADADAAAAAAAVAPPDGELVRRFCRNARFLRVLRPRSLEAECGGGSAASAAASDNFDEDFAIAGAVSDDLDMSGALARYEEAWREEQQEEAGLSDEAAAALAPPEALVTSAFGKCQSPALLYIGLRAADAVAEARGGGAARLPGAGLAADGAGAGAAAGPSAEALEADAVAVHAAALSLFGGAPSMAEVLPKFTLGHAREIVRYGGAEVHNIAAVMGGLASQEAVKLITHQYVPLNNTWIFNGVNCHSVALEL